MTIPKPVKYGLCSISSWHFQGPRKNILLKATARGGSTWLMELVAAQPGFRFYDEPFNIRRDNVRKAGLFTSWDDLQPEYADPDKIIAFLEALKNNSFRHMNPAPFRKYYRPVTNRIVFKIHELEHLIDQIADTCNCQVLYLVRHPIPNSLSRAQVPRLQNFLESGYYRERYIGSQRMDEIRSIADKGSRLQRFVVSWCFENYIPLKDTDLSRWTVLTYEELLLNSRKSCLYLSESLQLDDMQRLMDGVGTPSTNISMSGKEAIDIMGDPDVEKRQRQLVTRWKTKVTDQEEKAAMDVLSLFEIDAYTEKRFIASDRLLNFSDTLDKLESG